MGRMAEKETSVKRYLFRILGQLHQSGACVACHNDSCVSEPFYLHQLGSTRVITGSLFDASDVAATGYLVDVA